MNTMKRYSPEVRERAVRLVFEHQDEHPSQWAAIGSIAAKIGCTAETLRDWVRQAERDQGRRAGLTSDGAGAAQGTRAREPRAEAGERDSAQGVGVFRPGGARPPTEVMVAFIDDHRAELRGRADLRGAADRPVDVLRSEGPGGRSGAPAAAIAARRAAGGRDPARVRRELRRLRRPQGVAAARPRRDRGRPLHGGAADALARACKAWCAGARCPDDDRATSAPSGRWIW